MSRRDNEEEEKLRKPFSVSVKCFEAQEKLVEMLLYDEYFCQCFGLGALGEAQEDLLLGISETVL